MTLFRNTYRVESTRLKSWDYSWSGCYFVTIVVHDHVCLFGEVQNDRVLLSPLGQAVEVNWGEIPAHHHNVELDEYVVMPNHVHGIIILNEINDDAKANRRDVQLNVSTDGGHSPISPKKGSLPVVVRTFKAAVTTWARANGCERFRWQGRFYEHIIRNENDLHRIRQYIQNNRLRWELDEENPEKMKDGSSSY
jgi:putative transposase